eukprot:s362_g12.t1
MLAEATRLPTAVPYWQPDLALGWHVYRTGKDDLPLRSSRSKKRSAESLPAESNHKEQKPSPAAPVHDAGASTRASSRGLPVKLEEDNTATAHDSDVAAPVVFAPDPLAG